MFKGKRANLTLYIVWMFAAIVLVTIAGLLAPMGVLFNTEMYLAGEALIADANITASNITDPGIRAELQSIYAGSLNAVQTNIEVNNAAFQYSWVVVLLISAVAAFLFARRLVEFGNVGGGGFV